jgi:hypothetical protein
MPRGGRSSDANMFGFETAAKIGVSPNFLKYFAMDENPGSNQHLLRRRKIFRVLAKKPLDYVFRPGV